MVSRTKIFIKISLGLSLIALILSLVPLAQFRGGILAVFTIIFALFVLKWAREQNIDDKPAKKSIRWSIYALIFGLVVAGSCKMHSNCAYIEPFRESVKPLKQTINKEISEKQAAGKLEE